MRESIPLFELGEPLWPEALAHYFFAASGNDSFARMALGYRHMQGLGVPRSCQTAVLYYQPVAEQVVELARTPNSLPYVSRYPCPASVSECQLSGALIRLQAERAPPELDRSSFGSCLRIACSNGAPTV